MNIKRIYRKFMVDALIPFLVFGMLDIGTFLMIALNVRVEVVRSYQGNLVGERLVINDLVEPLDEKVYLFRQKGVKVTCLKIDSFENYDNMFTVVQLKEGSADISLEGTVNVDVVCNHTNLLKLVLRIDEKYI